MLNYQRVYFIVIHPSCGHVSLWSPCLDQWRFQWASKCHEPLAMPSAWQSSVASAKQRRALSSDRLQSASGRPTVCQPRAVRLHPEKTWQFISFVWCSQVETNPPIKSLRGIKQATHSLLILNIPNSRYCFSTGTLYIWRVQKTFSICSIIFL